MNYNDYDDYDDYEVLYDFDESEVESDSYSKPLSIPDAFLACRRQLHVANIGYIAELAHTTKEEVALALQGTALFLLSPSLPSSPNSQRKSFCLWRTTSRECT